MSAAASSGAAAAAAAEQHRQMCQEEEEMTHYQADELAENWEFKIVRSSMASFKKPERLRQVLEEEAQAGWVLVEKFDDSRIRLKRPAAARERDIKLDFDPYRTFVGPSQNLIALFTLGGVLGLALTVVLAVMTVKSCEDRSSPATATPRAVPSAVSETVHDH